MIVLESVAVIILAERVKWNVILRIDISQIYVWKGVNKAFNMDEGNEVLVCASEYVKGMLIFAFEKVKFARQFVHDFTV